jgi:tetratricopeptide (TPR) repeat protein
MKYSYYFLLLLAMFSCQEQDAANDQSKHHLKVANEAIAANNIPLAVEHYELATHYAATPAKEKIQYNLAYAYYLASAPSEALAVLAPLTPTAKNLWLKGLCYRYMENHTAAIKAYEEALGMTDQKNKAQLLYLQNWIGESLMDMGQYAEAEDIFHKNLREAVNDRNTYEALVNLGLLYYAHGNYPKAVNYLSQALTYEYDATFALKLAEAKHKTGDYNTANEIVKEVLGRPDLSVQDNMLAHVLLLEFKGEDVAALKIQATQPDRQAQIARLNAMQGATIGTLRIAAEKAQIQARTTERNLWSVAVVMVILTVVLVVNLRLIRRSLANVKRQKAALRTIVESTRQAVKGADKLDNPLLD